ncbi:MAG TPA: metallophosphoesterase [Solirubrobacteraceae bacterium]|nr:metallophosphoesterase [Solirubrobacteraceae bacterium]
MKALLPPERRDKPPFRWSNLGALLESRNDRLAKWLGDPSPDQRQLWLRDWYGGRQPDLRVDRSELSEPSFLLLGDTGEGDASQYALLAQLAQLGRDTDFMVICSDVIYPAGEVEEYEHKFFHPYRDYAGPIYALPGNHDWYDDLRGFMFHFCGRDRQPQRPKPSLFSRARLRERLWNRNPRPPDPARVARMRALRSRPEQQVNLPGPYYVVETGPIELVAIDTGIVSGIDVAQGEWLRRVSRSPKPKILLTGGPIYVDAQHRPCEIGGGGTVDAIVRDPNCNYIAAIGGDIHNYQRYTVDVDGRLLQYIVSGGGGAFMHATHKIPNIDASELPGVRESDFRCYPLRGDSLSFYSLLYDRQFPGAWAIDPYQAAAYMAERLGIEATKDDAKGVLVSDETRRRARRVFPLPGRGRGALHAWFSEFFDWNEPPLFKNVLRIDVTAERLTIECHAATGCVDDHLRKPEDRLVCERRADGGWQWQDDASGA